MTKNEELQKMRDILCDRIRDTIRDNSVNGVCSRCGQCCSNLLPMNLKDVERIRKYLQSHPIAPAPKERPEHRYYKITVEPCPFCDLSSGTATCMIFEVAPDICKKFICHAELLSLQYDLNGNIIENEIGQVDCRKTFFHEK